MQILMQIENSVCVFYLINTPFAAHYPYSRSVCRACYVAFDGVVSRFQYCRKLYYNDMKNRYYFHLTKISNVT